MSTPIKVDPVGAGNCVCGHRWVIHHEEDDDYYAGCRAEADPDHDRYCPCDLTEVTFLREAECNRTCGGVGDFVQPAPASPPPGSEPRDEASVFFEMRAKASVWESNFYDVLCEKYGGEGVIEDTSFDGYDSSFELYGAPAEWRLSPEALSWAWGLGFERCWINYANGTERYYHKGGNPDGDLHTDRRPSTSGTEARDHRRIREEARAEALREAGNECRRLHDRYKKREDGAQGNSDHWEAAHMEARAEGAANCALTIERLAASTGGPQQIRNEGAAASTELGKSSSPRSDSAVAAPVPQGTPGEADRVRSVLLKGLEIGRAAVKASEHLAWLMVNVVGEQYIGHNDEEAERMAEIRVFVRRGTP